MPYKLHSLAFLNRLLDAPSPSGFEQPAQRIWRKEIEGFADKVYSDVHGNAIAVVNPKAKTRIMLCGHSDEIGFMVKHISEDGFISFVPIGGIDANIVPTQKVFIHNEKEKVLGIVGKKPIHTQEKEERGKEVKMEQLWIDIGAKDKKQAEKLVSVGDPITLIGEFKRLLNGLIVSRGLDDKVGCFVVAEALRNVAEKNPKVALYGVSTVQEEIGLRGAITSTFGINPQVGIAIDTGPSADIPGMDKKKWGDISLGKGPVIFKGANINPVVHELLIKAAKNKKVPYQLQGYPGLTGTDARVIQVSRSGVATGLVSVSNRYLHTPIETVSIKDMEGAIELLTEFVLMIDEKTDFIPK